MGNLTNIDALRCECKPYCSDGNELELQKALRVACKRLGCTLEADGEYDPANERAIALAAVLVLVKYISLSSEREGDWQQGYNERLKDRILALCKANDLPAEEFVPDAVITLRDGSRMF